MSTFLPKKVSKARLRKAQIAPRNRLDIAKALLNRLITRRDLLKWGLYAGAGALALKNGLNPFVRSARASSTNSTSGIPTALPASPLFRVLPFTQPMPRFDILPRKAGSTLNPAPTAQPNTTQQPMPAALGGGQGPVEGRPPGPIWAHQSFATLPPQVAVEISTEGAKVNNAYNPGVASNLNSG